LIAAQAVRAAPMRRPFPTRSRHVHAVPRARRGAGTTWEVRTFVVVSAAICAVFLLVVLYLSQATAVATGGYETQRLERVRDELRRQNALLEVESARLDSPARIEAEAKRLGLVRVAAVPVVQAEPIAARR
jgi:cell division protein FtsL